MSEQSNKPETTGKTPMKKEDNEAFEKLKEFFSKPIVSLTSGGLIGYAIGNSGKMKAIDLETLKRERLQKQLKEAREQTELFRKQNKEQGEELHKLKEELTILKAKDEIQKQIAGIQEEKKRIDFLDENNYRKPGIGYGRISID